MRIATPSGEDLRKLFITFILLFLPGLSYSRAQQPDFLVVLGAGLPQPWVTEYTLGTDASDTPVTAAISTYPAETVCPLQCFGLDIVTIPANGTATSVGPIIGFPALMTAWSMDLGKGIFVRARTYDSADLARSVDLPVVSLSSILSLHPDRLIFLVPPRAARTNLLLADLSDPAPFRGHEATLRIDYLSEDGQPLAARSVTVSPQRQIYIVSLAESLGVSDPMAGQVRVSRVGGDGAFWGFLASTSPQGSISIVQGEAR